MREAELSTHKNLCQNLLFLAAASCFLAPLCAAGAQPSSPDPFAGDDRLAANRSVRVVTAPVRDLLADLTRQTGVAFFADEDVADEPLTAIAHNRPVAETLHAVESVFGYAWRRTGSGKSAVYTLGLSAETRKATMAGRDARLADAAERLRRENEEYFNLAGLSESQRRELAAELPSRLAAETDSRRVEQLRNTHAILLELNDGNSRRRWSPAVRGILKSLPSSEIASVLKGETLFFSWPKLPGCREFSASVLQELHQIGRTELGITSGFRGELTGFRLRIVGVGARQPYVTWHLSVGQRTSQFQTTTGYSGTAPSAWALSSGAPLKLISIPTEEWRRDPLLSANASVKLPAPSAPTRQDRSPVHRLGTMLEALDRAQPINVVADGLWSAHLSGFEASDAPIGEILSRLARNTGRHWKKAGAFVLLWSAELLAEREAEPPTTVVRRWAEAADRGIFTMEDLAEIAALPDPHLTTLQEMGMRGDFPILYSPLNTGRPHLRLWAALSTGQRRKAQADGLAYKEIDPGARLLFVSASTDPSARQLSSSPVTENQILEGRLRVTLRETQEWRVRGIRSAASWNVPRFDQENQPVPREEALKRFRALEESIKIEDVQLMTRIGVVFTYDSAGGSISSTWIDLPPRWSGASATSSSTL